MRCCSRAGTLNHGRTRRSSALTDRALPSMTQQRSVKCEWTRTFILRIPRKPIADSAVKPIRHSTGSRSPSVRVTRLVVVTSTASGSRSNLRPFSESTLRRRA